MTPEPDGKLTALRPTSGEAPGAVTESRFDPRSASSFVEKSLSEHTRRAYRLALAEFFRHSGMKHPSAVTPSDVIAWRDELVRKKRKAATVAFKLSVVRSFFEHPRATGAVSLNPASPMLVSPPALPEATAGRALTPREALILLAGPDRRKADGARDHALMLAMLRIGLRVSEARGLSASGGRWSHGRWTLRVKVKRGRERTLPLPAEVKRALDDYLRLDAGRRRNLHSGGAESFIFQPHTYYRTLEFAKPLSARMAHLIVAKWGDYCGLGRLSPHDLRRTAITRALNQGLSYREVQMMNGHKDPKTVMRYDHGRENMEQNAVNFLDHSATDVIPRTSIPDFSNEILRRS